MKRFATTISLTVALLIPGVSFAAPAITNVSGALAHGATVTVSGSGFGVKTQAAPVVWDDASTGTLLTDNGKWDGYWPNCAADHQFDLRYTTPIRGIELPHGRISKYIAGAHAATGAPNSNCGYDVGFWKYRTLEGFPSTTYISWYYRADDNFVFGLNEGDNNFKSFALDDGFDTPYGGDDTTNINYAVPYVPGTDPQWLIYDGGTIGGTTRLQLPDINGHNGYWGGGVNIFGGEWVKEEIEYRHDTGNGGTMRMWENGVLVVNYAGRTGFAGEALLTIGIGGYGRNYPDENNWRYFADVYYDTTASRVLLCTGPTYALRGLCEIQIPSSWSDTALTLTTNLGQFTTGTAYLYVVDSTGAVNETGYPITVGGAPDTTPPTAPSGLGVQ